MRDGQVPIDTFGKFKLVVDREEIVVHNVYKNISPEEARRIGDRTRENKESENEKQGPSSQRIHVRRVGD